MRLHDVLAPFTKFAVKLANEKYGTDICTQDIRSWGTSGDEKIQKTAEFYNDERIFAMQEVSAEAKDFFRQLQKKGDVYIITAVNPKYMSIRARQIKEAFPDFPDENIIMGSAKNLVKFDVTLDDAPHNILKSCADYPVLFRQPWNQSLSGVLSVNTYRDFLVLVDQIKASMTEDRKVPQTPSVIALVGPTGSNKNTLAAELNRQGIAVHCPSWSEKEDRNHTRISMGELVTQTVYAGNTYKMYDGAIRKCLQEGKNAVAVVDMCGAMALKKFFPTVLVFCKRSREDMIGSILQRNIPNEEKKIRILSMENEIKHRKLCDFAVCTDDVAKAAGKIKELFN